jgi:hypothetical protein
VSSDGLRAQIEAADKGTILVNRVHGATPYGTHYVSITGTVGQDLSVTENAFENLGNSFGTFPDHVPDHEHPCNLHCRYDQLQQTRRVHAQITRPLRVLISTH